MLTTFSNSKKFQDCVTVVLHGEQKLQLLLLTQTYALYLLQLVDPQAARDELSLA
jgi:hypothetical protein